MATAPTQEWFVEHKDKVYGPMATDRLKALAKAGKISPDDQVRSGTDGPWQQARSLSGLFPTTAAPPPAPAPPLSSSSLSSSTLHPTTLNHSPAPATATSASGSVLKWLLAAALLLVVGAVLFGGGIYVGILYARLTAPITQVTSIDPNALSNISQQIDGLKQQLSQQQSTPQQSSTDAQLLGTLNALLGAKQSVSEPPPPTNQEFVESVAEPTEEQMQAAYERRIAAVNEHVEKAENATVDPNDPMAAIAALNAEAFRDSRLVLKSFKKLSAAPAINPPGYICEYEADVRATGAPNPAFHDILAESGTVAKARFAETADGWVVLPVGE